VAAFLGTHTIISGYTTVDTLGFMLSGALGSLGPIAGMVAIGYVHARGEVNSTSVAPAPVL
jgi:hypothetical protein